jgi:hypothetical protein
MENELFHKLYAAFPWRGLGAVALRLLNDITPTAITSLTIGHPVLSPPCFSGYPGSTDMRKIRR